MTSQKKRLVVEFRRSLALSMVVDLSFLAMSDEFEGFDQWIYSTFSALSSDLRLLIRPLFKTFGNELLFDELVQLTAEPPIDDLTALIRWISELEESSIHRSHLRLLRSIALAKGIGETPIDPSIVSDKPKLERFLHATLSPKLSKQEINVLLRLLLNPEQLQAELTLLLVRFWDRHYRTEYARCMHLEKRSVEHLRKQAIPDDPSEAFTTMTGRPVPDRLRQMVSAACRLVFIPSCHAGPYASVNLINAEAGDVAVIYNCLPVAQADPGSGFSTSDLFPPLRALADETRLNILAMLVGRELYAQQIVDRIEITQSVVSRHLRLMEACGILNVRKQEGMKFYGINTATLTQLAERLAAISSPEMTEPHA